MPDSTDLAVVDAAATDDLDLRRLAPIPDDQRPPTPDRFSQTLLRHHNDCQRAAFLYVKHHGGMPAHALDRGTALHMAQARVTELLIEQYALDGGAGDVDYTVDEHTAKLLLNEVWDARPDLTVPLHERDSLRQMMSHLAHGFPINPATVVAVERKFLIHLGEHTISAVIDLAHIDGQSATIRDYKTEWLSSGQSDYEATFQGRLYAVALVYGNPITRAECDRCAGAGAVTGVSVDGMPPPDDRCEDCDGRGYVELEEPPLGEHLQTVDVGEVFPRHLSCVACGSKDRDGSRCKSCGGQMRVPVLHVPFDRIDIDALRGDLEQMCNQLSHAFATGDFPAVSGSHCKRCPCEPECPLPRHLRNYAGAITTSAQAAEAAEWWQRASGRIGATWTELRSYCKVNGPIRFGRDQVLEFVTESKRETDYPGMEQAANHAARYGEPFQIEDWTRRKPYAKLKARTMTEAELAAEADR